MNSLISKRIAQLDKSTTRFIEFIARHEEGQRQLQPQTDAWNMLQVIDHIVTAETAVAANFIKRPPSLSEYKTNFRQSFNNLLLGIVMKAPIRVKAPSSLQPPKGDQSLEVYKERLEKVRSQIISEAKGMPSDRLNRTVMKHPVAGPLTFPQTLNFMAIHIDSHYKQLQRISKVVAGK